MVEGTKKTKKSACTFLENVFGHDFLESSPECKQKKLGEQRGTKF